MPETDSKATKLTHWLQRRIIAEGPLSLTDFMAEALNHPDYGYYVTGCDPLGVTGDFITAPEISQIFGELIGLWLLSHWQARGRPSPIQLVELGPGRGTLMLDILRTTIRLDPNFRAAIEIHLIEISQIFRNHQESLLVPECARQGITIHWHTTFGSLEPNLPLWLIANEFLDALPVQQFLYDGVGWRERQVTFVSRQQLKNSERPLNRSFEPIEFEFTLGPRKSVTAGLIPEALLTSSALFPGCIAEICPAARTLAADIGARLTDKGGIALFIDYGTTDSRFGSSLQAVQNHQFVHPLAHPGTADLSAHVDFAQFSKALAQAGAETYGPISQRDFLLSLGLYQRAQTLMRDPKHKIDIETAIERLINLEEMGLLFKILIVTEPDILKENALLDRENE